MVHWFFFVAPLRSWLPYTIADDNGWAGVGYNNPYVQTPTLDALAKGGLTLTAHCTSCNSKHIAHLDFATATAC